jgi:hypothetical protein
MCCIAPLPEVCAAARRTKTVRCVRPRDKFPPILSEEEWNRPAQEVSPTEAYEFLVDALNDYGMQRSQRYMELQLLKSEDPELQV